MAKRQASPYLTGIRSRDWIKIKKQLTLDLVVGGYIPGNGPREPFFGGLLLGAYDDSGELIYTGRVGPDSLNRNSKRFSMNSSHLKFLPSLILQLQAM
jgi:ATP-dependent DNA ligase